jgi:hypothetical protein
MDRLVADSYYPGLGVWAAIEAFLGGGHGVVGEFKVAGFDVVHEVLPQGKSPRFCRCCLFQLGGVSEFRKSRHPGGQILLCCSGVGELSWC